MTINLGLLTLTVKGFWDGTGGTFSVLSLLCTACFVKELRRQFNWVKMNLDIQT